METNVRELQELNGDYWYDHPDYVSDDWKYEVANGDTRRGYWEWVKTKLENQES